MNITDNWKNSLITINGLEVDVNLGWEERERVVKQSVLLDIKVRFVKPPLACITDNLNDTFCYDELIKKIKNFLESRQFRLIEYLAHEIYQLLKNALKDDTLISLRVNKKPLIANLTGGTSFYYGDETERWSF